MKTRLLLLFIICLSFGMTASADDFLGAPLMNEGQIVVKTDSRLVMTTPLSHDKIMDFYRTALKDQKDIKFRDWKDASYIEDDGKRQWHSITVSKGDGKAGTTVTIVKDNWTWIIGTLLLRYVGVFVVLMILFLSMTVAGKIISRTVKRMEAGKTGG